MTDTGVRPRLKRAILDMVIREHVCNFDCDYCGLAEPGRQRQANSLEPGTPLRSRVEKVLERVLSLVEVPVLKLSGGEVFLLPGFLDFLRRVRQEFPLVQITTNGSLLNQDLVAAIAAMRNVQFNYSLDGHTLAMNANRLVRGTPQGQEQLNQRLIDNLRLVLEHGIPVEINMVLSGVNAAHFLSFLEFLDSMPAPPKVFPFPVRWRPGFRMNREIYEAFRSQVEAGLRLFPHLLPPASYFNHLTTFLPDYKRRQPCDLPLLVLGLNDEGEVLRCPCGFDRLGNLLADEAIGDRLPGPGTPRKEYAVSLCRGCFTHYEIYNQMLQGAQAGIEHEAAHGGLLAEPAFRTALEATMKAAKELVK